MTKPYAVYADRYGRIREEPGLTALGANGENWVEMEELIPLHPGSNLFSSPPAAGGEKHHYRKGGSNGR